MGVVYVRTWVWAVEHVRVPMRLRICVCGGMCKCVCACVHTLLRAAVRLYVQVSRPYRHQHANFLFPLTVCSHMRCIADVFSFHSPCSLLSRAPNCMPISPLLHTRRASCCPCVQAAHARSGKPSSSQARSGAPPSPPCTLQLLSCALHPCPMRARPPSSYACCWTRNMRSPIAW